MPIERSVRAQRALRLASGTASSLAIGFGLDLPIPFLAPVLAMILAMTHRPLSAEDCLKLMLAAILTTGCGLLLIPVLRYYPLCGVLLVGLGLFVAFRYGLSGGNVLVMTFLVIGLTMIPAAGTADFGASVMVIAALVQGLLLAVVALFFSHCLFPEPSQAPTPPMPTSPSPSDTGRLALRATLIVLPTFLLALIEPTKYLPIILKAVGLGQQSSSTAASQAGRELLGSTLLGGWLAVAFWCVLSLFVHLWMFFLWTLLVALLLGCKLYGLDHTRLSPGFWLNTLMTMIILLGQSVQDSAGGKDVYTAFAVRMSLFIAVTLYAWLIVHWLDRHRSNLPAPG